MKNFIFLMLLICCSMTLFSYCSRDKQPLIPVTPHGDDYMPGMVGVGLASYITQDFFLNFLDEMNLQPRWLEIDSTFVVRVEADSHDVSRVEERLLQSHLIIRVFIFWQSASSSPGKVAMNVQFKDNADSSYVKTILDDIGGVELVRFIYRDDNALINVPVGTELYWTNKLKQYSFVLWAELIYCTKAQTD